MAAVVGNTGDVPRPTGKAAALTVLPYWPSISETELQALADDERATAKAVAEYAADVQRERARGAELLEGQAGVDAEHAHAVPPSVRTGVRTLSGPAGPSVQDTQGLRRRATP